MGLDVVVLTHIKKTAITYDDYEANEAALYKTHMRLEPHMNFTEQADDMEPGVYQFEKAIAFYDGSYTGYNLWRKRLALIVAGREPQEIWDNPDPDIPFVKLINFSDCEGVFGAQTCKALAAEFHCWGHAVEGQSPEFQSIYWEFHKAFQTAATTDGVVVFH